MPISAPISSERYRSGEAQLFPVRLRTRELPPAGAHIEFVTRADDGQLYYCKSDRMGVPCRMREAFFSQLATEVGLAPPDFRIVEDELTGETFFGSRRHPSTIADLEKKKFLRTERKDELGRHLPFPSRWFSQLYAFDMLVGNGDRSADNILGLADGPAYSLRPIDFSASDLGYCEPLDFPDGKSETVRVARDLRTVHGFFADSASQMLDQLRAVPSPVIKSFFDAMPSEWVNSGEREHIGQMWSGSFLVERLDALRAGLADGSLI